MTDCMCSDQRANKLADVPEMFDRAYTVQVRGKQANHQVMSSRHLSARTVRPLEAWSQPTVP